MKVNEFLTIITESYKKQFSNSIIKAQLYNGLGKSKNIYIKCLLAGDKSELSGGYVENDMFSIVFWGHDLPNDITLDSEIPKNLTLKCTEKSYLIVPEDKYMCYGRRKLSYRKTVGDEKIIKSLDKFFIKLKQQLETDLKENQIHDNFKDLLIKKLS